MPGEIKRLVNVTEEDIESGNPLIEAIKRCWPEAKYVNVVGSELGINFSMDNASPHQSCLYVTLPEHIFNWHRTYLKKMDNPDLKIKVEPIVFGLCFSAEFLKPKHIDRIDNNPLNRPNILPVSI